MPYTRDDLIAETDRRLKDLRPFLSPGDVGSFVDDAVLRHSVDHPRVVAVERTSDGKRLQPLGTIPEFEPGWARPILRLEYPKVTAGGDREGMARKWWDLYPVPGDSAPQLLFVDGSQPPASAVYVLHLRTRHTADSAPTTLRDHEARALPWLAASLGCLVIGARTAQSLDPNIGDSVDYGQKPDTFRELAEAFREHYEQALKFGDEPGRPEKRLVAARRIDWDYRAKHGSLATHDEDE